jgi:hypothetical protein
MEWTPRRATASALSSSGMSALYSSYYTLLTSEFHSLTHMFYELFSLCYICLPAHILRLHYFSLRLLVYRHTFVRALTISLFPNLYIEPNFSLLISFIVKLYQKIPLTFTCPFPVKIATVPFPWEEAHEESILWNNWQHEYHNAT